MLSHFLGLSELDKGEGGIVWMADGQRLNKEVFRGKGEKRWFGTSVSFAEKRRGKELNGAFASTTVSCAVGKGRNSLRVNTGKGVAGEGWNKGRSASCVGDYLSS